MLDDRWITDIKDDIRKDKRREKAGKYYWIIFFVIICLFVLFPSFGESYLYLFFICVFLGAVILLIIFPIGEYPSSGKITYYLYKISKELPELNKDEKLIPIRQKRLLSLIKEAHKIADSCIDKLEGLEGTGYINIPVRNLQKINTLFRKINTHITDPERINLDIKSPAHQVGILADYLYENRDQGFPKNVEKQLDLVQDTFKIKETEISPPIHKRLFGLRISKEIFQIPYIKPIAICLIVAPILWILFDYLVPTLTQDTRILVITAFIVMIFQLGKK